MSGRNILFYSLTTFMLMGCATPAGSKVASPAAATASSAGRLSLEVLMLKPTGGLRSLGRGDLLHAGDHYNLRIVADRPACLHVVLMGNRGPRTLLGPPSAAAPVPPGTATVVPDSDVLTVGAEAPERVFVIAAPTPLNAAQLQAQLAQAQEATAEDVRDPPPISGPQNRPGEPSRLQLTSFGRDGIAALWFALTR